VGGRNRLFAEKSPYLLQHADNPVDWYPWGEDAFEKARREHKPIFLSIGYSTCHWCHVMAHESFEDSEIAREMNEVFVSVKVDREERPDIDAVYMTVCQLMTGSGGWPLTIIMTPDKEPFFAGTYFPKESMYGRIGMRQLIGEIARVWKEQQGRIEKITQEVKTSLVQLNEEDQGETAPYGRLAQNTYQAIRQSYDRKNGGFGTVPKFPNASHLFFLLRYWRRTGEKEALDMVVGTLEAMRCGGIYDQIGFGFHRYSTDGHWLVPHFEKMLYDQALLLMVYTEAFQATEKKIFKKTAQEIITYVLRDMTSREGGFFSAEDADSEGEEGKYYLWTIGELAEGLGAQEVEASSVLYNLESAGNYRDERTGRRNGKNIPHLKRVALRNDTSGNFSPSAQEHNEVLRRKMYALRSKRVRPHRDEKILTDWNGLMIAALAKAGRVFDNKNVLEAAMQAAELVLEKLTTSNKRLMHMYKDGVAEIDGTAGDYVYLVWGLFELYESSFIPRYLENAVEINETFMKHFRDEQRGEFFMTADDAEKLLVRSKDIYDGAIPSSSSVGLYNILRLSLLTEDHVLYELAQQTLRAYSSQVSKTPTGHTFFLSAALFGIEPGTEVVIVGERGNEETEKMLGAISAGYYPNTVLAFKNKGEKPQAVDQLIPSMVEKKRGRDGATAYVCRNFSCLKPVDTAEEMVALMEMLRNEPYQQ
jgi:uncharacterized protein YyaL (SSP411 family)